MIDLLNLSVQFSGEYLFKDVNLKINSSDKIALVGANGAGKTTLFRIISGMQQPESGKVLMQKGISLGYLPQEIVIHSGKPLFEEVKTSLRQINSLGVEEHEITLRLEDSSLPEEERDQLIHKLGEIHHRMEEVGYYGINSEIEKVLIGLGFEEKDFIKQTNAFSGGWQMRIALAKLLLSNHEILLLDEPTNHLDLDSLEWLISFLKGYKGALLVISHDKHFVNEVTTKTLEIFLNKISFFNGNFDAYLKFKDERDSQLEARYILQQKKIKETEKFIERFRYKATKAKQVQSRIKQLEKVEQIDMPEFEEEINIRFPDPPQSGVVPLELVKINKSFEDNHVLQNIDFRLDRGDKIAFVGPNGAGKTTLSKIISGRIPSDSGERIIGHNTIISYYAQDVADSLEPSFDILQTVEGIGENKTIGQLRSILGSFLFTGDDVFKKVQVLSGGEKSRVALAKILLTKANLIVLDEPTNHLDISSKQVLQKALIDFKGTLILVSHDVDFLKPVVNKVCEIRNHSAKIYYGGIDYYLEKKNEAAAAEKPAAKQNEQNNTGSRKDQKRLEAELRQKKYAATKDIVKEISALEVKIEALEEKRKQLESDLADPSVYSNSQMAKEKTSDYNSTKEGLEKCFEKWTELTEKLEEIENSFS
ncbi:MAG: ABC-F family ATP-binding cassette domain-containing protein [Bacteroidota bacterium]|jgi:ATP-binding cassette subfamily F protein 3|nr:ABC-F family ATP-binding cassette domain-containing protein [Ignavibacteria bacterium]MCU7499002.1 ABC-F family ATP-binding cassette domain-containing protein [Ignavibacteria bacterium]MCU7512424.1 ABC-F family ATP-binding cassette domain-containing protein [Ignavibacteria bacterium]MCU7518605.1 ABC-F family ATP-binding cassette domain-containing protein [Ignavibacteria bacterium]MCU7524289.1 ABC-F family ATP-binding cassette domain-containing protein [Ignavibacteria bacterium]